MKIFNSSRGTLLTRWCFNRSSKQQRKNRAEIAPIVTQLVKFSVRPGRCKVGRKVDRFCKVVHWAGLLDGAKFLHKSLAESDCQ